MNSILVVLDVVSDEIYTTLGNVVKVFENACPTSSASNIEYTIDDDTNEDTTESDLVDKYLVPPTDSPHGVDVLDAIETHISSKSTSSTQFCKSVIAYKDLV